MVYIYFAYALYIFFTCRYFYADYSDDFKRKVRTKVPLALLYLIIALLAYFLNTVDGRLVASEHFMWIFGGMLFCFFGDIFMLNAKENKQSLNLGIFMFLIAHIVFATYITLYLYNNAGQLYNLRELIIFGAGIIFTIFFVTRKRIDFKGKRLFVIIYILISLYMVVKASSLIEFMNTSVSWPIFLGLFFTSISDIFLAFKYFSDKQPKYSLAVALVLYYSGMAILPFAIYYV